MGDSKTGGIPTQLAKAYLNSETLLAQVSKDFFDRADADGSGFLEFNELTECVEDLYQRLGGIAPVGNEQLSAWLRDHDTDGDGKLSRAEFQALFKDTLRTSLDEDPAEKTHGGKIQHRTSMVSALVSDKQRKEEEEATRRLAEEAARKLAEQAEEEEAKLKAAEEEIAKKKAAAAEAEKKKKAAAAEEAPMKPVKEEWQGVFETLQATFPNKTEKEIRAALKRTDGHAGRAKRFLRD